MTPRQWNLFKLLSENPDKWFSQKEIVDALEGYAYQNRNNDKCPAIREDKIAINKSQEVDKIVVMKNYKFKIGTEKEILEERKRHLKRLIKQKQEIEDLDYKLGRNNQGKLLSNQGNVIDENSNAKEFHETYLI